MIAAWLASFFKLAEISTLMLRAQLGILVLMDALPEQRRAIAHELAVRAWAEAVEERLGEPTCVWTSRGGRS